MTLRSKLQMSDFLFFFLLAKARYKILLIKFFFQKAYNVSNAYFKQRQQENNMQCSGVQPCFYALTTFSEFVAADVQKTGLKSNKYGEQFNDSKVQFQFSLNTLYKQSCFS